MSIGKYPVYQNSGFGWLGEIPKEWLLKRLGHFFSERREKVSDKEFKPLSVTKLGVVPRLDTAAKSQDGDNRKKVLSGDFVINSRSDRKGSSGLAELDGSVSLICIVLEPNGISGRFAHHLLRSRVFQEEFYRNGKGIVADLWSTGFAEMKNIVIPIPSMPEQTQIARFLDHETAKIDTLIREQERLIELLQEKRQAVISHAVTKGLDPDVPMKDSGVEWLGEVPAHWDCSAIKRYCSLIKDGTHLPPPRVSDGVPLLSVRNIVDGEFVKRSDDSNISQKDYIDLCRSFIPQKGDVLLAIVGATLGKTAIICNDVGKFHIQRSLALFRVIPAEMTPEWLHWVVRSTGFRSLLWEYAGFSAQPGIYLGTLASFSIPVPPVEEQIKIGEEIHCKIAPMTTLIYEAKKAVTLIKERRSALISAAVTGKIDVRGWKPPEDESAFAESGTENIEATV
jgi:type I restriction enzyme S subunit